MAEGDFSKPAAAHALAALRCALGDPLEVALAAAADLQMGRESTGWGRLNGARISAFEDGAAGLVSARAAGRLLAQQGISTDIRLYGISQEKAKQQALADVGGQLFPDLAAALRVAGVQKRSSFVVKADLNGRFFITIGMQKGRFPLSAIIRYGKIPSARKGDLLYPEGWPSGLRQLS